MMGKVVCFSVENCLHEMRYNRNIRYKFLDLDDLMLVKSILLMSLQIMNEFMIGKLILGHVTLQCDLYEIDQEFDEHILSINYQKMQMIVGWI
jgi:hypothetical protein